MTGLACFGWVLPHTVWANLQKLHFQDHYVQISCFILLILKQDLTVCEE